MNSPGVLITSFSVSESLIGDTGFSETLFFFLLSLCLFSVNRDFQNWFINIIYSHITAGSVIIYHSPSGKRPCPSLLSFHRRLPRLP